MKTERKYYYLGLISFANDSLIGVEFGNGYKIEKWNIKNAIDIIKRFEHLNENQLTTTLAQRFFLDRKENHAYVISGLYEDTEKEVENGLKLMRLFKEGSIDIPYVYIYEKKGNRIEPVYSHAGMPINPETHYTLTAKERLLLNNILKKQKLPFPLPYAQLALDNFD